MEQLKAEIQVMQLLYKLREKGVISTDDMRQILDNAETEFMHAKEAVEKQIFGDA